MADIVQKLIGYGVPADHANILGAVAGAESGYNPNAIGDQKYGGSVGLFQINIPAHADKLRRWTGSNNRQDWVNWLQDPDNNAYAASQIYKGSGLGAWTAYNTGAYKQYLGSPGVSRGGVSREQQIRAMRPIQQQRGYNVPMLNNLDYFREVKRKMLANEPLIQKFNQPRYESGVSQARANLADILQRLTASPTPTGQMPRYGEEVRRYNAFADAPLLAQAISAFQTAQRPEDITLGQRAKIMEARRQAMVDALNKRQVEAGITGYDPETGQPTWEREAQERSLALSEAKAAMDATMGGGSSGATVKPTAEERRRSNIAKMYNLAISKYEGNKKAGYKYPLYYTINSILNDPDWVEAAIEGGLKTGDVKSIIDNLITMKGHTTPAEYFSQGTGAKLKGYYESHVNKTLPLSYEGG